MKKSISLLICTIFMIVSIFLILNGGIKFSSQNIYNIDRLVEFENNIKVPALFENKSKNDVIVAFYGYENNPKLYYIAEFTKNIIFDKYSLEDITLVSEDIREYNSTISSAIYNYTYNINFKSREINVYDGSVSGNILYALFLFVVGILGFITMIKNMRIA